MRVQCCYILGCYNEGFGEEASLGFFIFKKICVLSSLLLSEDDQIIKSAS